MDEKKNYRLGKQILTEDDLNFQVEYKEEIFTLRYPNPAVRSNIESEIARRLGGMSRDSYPVDHLAMIEATVYADNLVVREESPDWFTSAWTCYDDECIANLYAGYLRFREQFREKLRSSGFQRAGKSDSS